MDRLTEIAQVLGNHNTAAALNTDELRDLRSELRELGQAIGAGTLAVSNVVAGLEACVQAVEAVDSLIEARAAEATKVTDLTARLAAAPGAPRLPSTAAMAASRPRDAAPSVTNVEPRIERLRDRAWVDIDELCQEFSEAMGTIDEWYGTKPQKVALGRIRRPDFPAERHLGQGDDRANNQKLAALLDGAYMPDRWTDTLVASGGWCSPAMPSYDIPIVAGTHRPVRDYLPGFQADRGQVISITPPALSAVKSSSAQVAGSAVSVWPNSVDVSPGSTVKPFQTVQCPTNVTTAAEAIVEQLQIGSFVDRGFPELIQTWIGLATAAHARRAEGQLLQAIHNNVTSATTTPQILGSGRDFFPFISQGAARYRWRNRMPHDAKLRLLVPSLIIDHIAADVGRQQPGDGLESFAWGEPEFRAALAAKSINVTLYEDVPDSVSAAVRARYEGAQGNTELGELPLTVISYLFHEGAFSMLDAGTLDLGVIRDSTLNSTNDFRYFVEAFEGVIPRVIEAVEITHSLAPLGTAPALVSDVGAYFGSAS